MDQSPHYQTPLSRNTSSSFKTQLPTELALSDFNAQRCVHWSMERLCFPWWHSTQYAYFFENCSYVGVLFGHYGPEYTTHLINYGQNNPNGIKK